MTNFGEGAGMSTDGPPPKIVVFEAELVEVNFKSTQKTALERAVISGPHWKSGTDVVHEWRSTAKDLGIPVFPFSKKPAVYLIDGAKGADHSVEVKVKVTKSENVSGNAKLFGLLGVLEIEGECPTGVGEHTVNAKFKKAPKEIYSFRGAVPWGLELSFGSYPLGNSLLEIYFILAPPTKSWSTIGVWAEALRFLFGRIRVSGSKPIELAARVTRYCHSDHKLVYDTVSGAPSYWSKAGMLFKVELYMHRIFKKANCYDQASAVQVFCGALGIEQDWLYLDPFGYIHTTHLLGVGLCNNPFFSSSKYSSDKVVPRKDPYRSGFGNHAFVGQGKKVLDACGGPHTGYENRRWYVAASIDRDGPSPGGGTANMIQNFGIVDAV